MVPAPLPRRPAGKLPVTASPSHHLQAPSPKHNGTRKRIVKNQKASSTLNASGRIDLTADEYP